MKDFINLKNISYKLYSKGSVCKKSDVISKFSHGILVYIDHVETITVYCIILPDFSDVPNMIQEIGSIPLPTKIASYKFMYINPAKTAKASVAMISSILSILSSNNGKPYAYKCFKHKNTNDIFNPISLIIEAEDHQINHISEQYNVESVLPSPPKPPVQLFQPVNSDELISQINNWLKNTSFKDFREAIEKHVIGQSNLPYVLLAIYMYLRNVASGKTIKNNNIILAGPSGTGKTETFRAIKEYFKEERIPKLIVSIRDMSSLTSEGYKGNDTEYIVQEVRGKTNGIAIIFLDEFDKRLVPDYNSSDENVNAAIQAQILTVVEGRILCGIDTTKTMFIAMGAFDYVRSERATEKRIGFGVDRKEKSEEFYDEITREDLISMGALYELVGRFSDIISYGALSPEAIDKIIDLRLEEISQEIEIPITINDSMRKHLHDNSNTAFGNRLIYSLLKQVVNRALLEIYTNEISVSRIVIKSKEEYEIESNVLQNDSSNSMDSDLTKNEMRKGEDKYEF